MSELSKRKKLWLTIKTGNRLVFRDVGRWAKGDGWAWSMTLATIIFIVFIYVFESFLIANLWACFLLLAIFVGFCLTALWKIFKLESR